MKFDYCIFIGRCQPPHFGHLALIREALIYAKYVIVVLGSCNGSQSRTKKNPWFGHERMLMISDSLLPEERARVTYVYQPDVPGDDEEWVNLLRQKVNTTINSLEPAKNIALIGHYHDASSFYLKMFPEWEFLPQANLDQFPHATILRDWYFNGSDEYKKFVPEAVAFYIESLKDSSFYHCLKQNNS